MILRAQAVGEEPALRFVIVRVDADGDMWWDGDDFTTDFKYSQKYAHPSDACFQIQDILRDYYGQLPKRKFVVPVEVDVYGDVSLREIMEYLHRATVLSVRTEEFGNGPKETYVAPIIHWGYLKDVTNKGSKIEDLAVEWDIDNMEEADENV